MRPSGHIEYEFSYKFYFEAAEAEVIRQSEELERVWLMLLYKISLPEVLGMH